MWGYLGNPSNQKTMKLCETESIAAQIIIEYITFKTLQALHIQEPTPTPDFLYTVTLQRRSKPHIQEPTPTPELQHKPSAFVESS